MTPPPPSLLAFSCSLSPFLLCPDTFFFVDKVLAEMAVTEPYSFRAVVETVKAKGSSQT